MEKGIELLPSFQVGDQANLDYSHRWISWVNLRQNYTHLRAPWMQLLLAHCFASSAAPPDSLILLKATFRQIHAMTSWNRQLSLHLQNLFCQLLDRSFCLVDIILCSPGALAYCLLMSFASLLLLVICLFTICTMNE